MHSMRLSTNNTFRLASLSAERLEQAVSKNLDEMARILEWMDGTDMRLFRIGSSFVPFASHPAMTFDWEALCRDRLAELGKRYEPRGFRFSLHPGQYNVLNSENPETVRKTVAELEYSCRILEMMGLDYSHKVILHGGCRCGDLRIASARLAEAVQSLPDPVCSRLVLENDERIFSLADIVDVCEQTGVPAVFDIHHARFLPSESMPELLERVAATWGGEHGTPKMHISSQRPEARDGKHDDMVRREDVAELCALVPYPFDLMVEAKHKETAAAEVLAHARELGCAK